MIACPTLLAAILAVGPSASGSASAEVSTDGAAADAEGDADGESDGDPWIRRFPPERNMWELGVYGGLFLPSAELELFQPMPDRPGMGVREYDPVALDLGGRVGYYPLRFLGLEVEGGVMPSQTSADLRAILYHARGHLVAQVARWSVTPFAVAGVSGLGVASKAVNVGDDIDLGFHFGGGVKVYFNRWTMLRLDLRDTLTARVGLGEGVANSFEVLLGMSVTLGRKKVEPELPKDTDGDGFIDPEDRCPREPGVAPDGCPIPDTDGDGFLDPDDRCPKQPGVPPDGCPIGDTDGDGFMDDVDQCVDVPGVEPDGCPIGDTDGDGILDDVDVCIDKPETFNGFEDADGCPDEVPKEIEQFEGVIEGIYFDTNKATIKAASQPKLDEAVQTLKKYPQIRLEISGHTDSRGSRDYNVDLSQQRAEAVRDYLVGAGIDAGRLETRGAGPDEPRDTNRTDEGRANNRRIEFIRLD